MKHIDVVLMDVYIHMELEFGKYICIALTLLELLIFPKIRFS